MHIEDLQEDVELDSAAMAAVHGGIAMHPQPLVYPKPELPDYSGDIWGYNSKMLDYIGTLRGEDWRSYPQPSVRVVPFEKPYGEYQMQIA